MSAETAAGGMHELARRLFPICRSITGDGVRESLKILSEIVPLNVHEVPSGTAALDWTVPKEWNIRDAWIKDPSGRKVLDFKVSNLHVVGYSTPIHRKMTLAELQPHLYSLPAQPNAIPYVTSYYSERWGFCLTEDTRRTLKDGEYEVFIDSTLAPGALTYADLVIPGESAEEVFFSTYICHPSLANNELSGPVVAIHLAQWLKTLPKRRYTYRFAFLPETIGAIVYLSRHLAELKEKVRAGFVLSCIGDERNYSYLSSRKGNGLADRVAKHVLRHIDPAFRSYGYGSRGSDERQYCAPGVDLPMASLMRTRYADYPEYHTSLDDLTLVTEKGLRGGLNVCQQAVRALELNRKYQVTVLGEPQLGKRGLYPTLSQVGERNVVLDNMMDVLSYSDGDHDLLSIAEMRNAPIGDFEKIVADLLESRLLREVR